MGYALIGVRIHSFIQIMYNLWTELTYRAPFKKEPLILSLHLDMMRHLGKSATVALRLSLHDGIINMSF